LPEILIEHCTLRVVRRHVWSWGLPPERLLENALRLLPDRLAAKLEGMFTDGSERIYETPLRIHLKFTQTGFDEAAPSVSCKPFASDAALSAFESQLEQALSEALAVPSKPATPSVPPASRRQSFLETMARRPLPAVSPDSFLQHFLYSLLETNELESFFARFSLEELEVWHEAIYGRSQQPARLVETTPPEIASELEASLSSREPNLSFYCAQRLRLRLILNTKITNKFHRPLSDPTIWLALDRCVPLEARASSAADALTLPHDKTEKTIRVPGSRPDPSALIRAIATEAAREIPIASSNRSTEWTTHVDSVLPFLLLHPLRRIEYFSALGAVLETAHLTDRAPLFAAALAYKVLMPPERGWRRSPSARHSAGIFAGAPSAVSDDSLHEFSRLISMHTGPLDRWLADAVSSGRNKADPVLLCRAESENLSGFLLIDPHGCFPFALVADAAEAASLLKTIGPSLVLVSAAASGPRVLRHLNEAGLAFITEVPPVQGENWRAIARGASRLGWTNHPEPTSEFLARAARTLELSSSESSGFWAQLGPARPAVPRAQLPALERSVTLAAGVALGLVAWQLWSERGRTAPHLALERLGDLDATVHFSAETIRVGLPRGRRHSELQQAGYLAPVSDAPWLEGRRVEFGLG